MGFLTSSLCRQLTYSLFRSKPFDVASFKRSGNNNTFEYDSLARFGDNNRVQKENRFAQKFDGGASKKRSHPKCQEKHRNPRKTIRFQFETGSTQAQNAVKSIISDVHSFSKSYRVNFVEGDKGGLQQKHLVDIVNSLDLAVDGIFCVPPLDEKSLPIIKINKVHEMIKSYTDKLALAKEQELLEKGSIVAQKVIRLRDRAEKKKSATKVLTVSWGISNSDLSNQKSLEIQKRMDKGEHFLLYLGERKSFYSARQLAAKENGLGLNGTPDIEELVESDIAEMDVEQRKRLNIFQNIKTLLDESSCQYDVSGNLESRVLFTCLPVERMSKAKDPERKETKKTKKAAKQHQATSKKTMSEEELDSLYLFKVE